MHNMKDTAALQHQDIPYQACLILPAIKTSLRRRGILLQRFFLEECSLWLRITGQCKTAYPYIWFRSGVGSCCDMWFWPFWGAKVWISVDKLELTTPAWLLNLWSSELQHNFVGESRWCQPWVGSRGWLRSPSQRAILVGWWWSPPVMKGRWVMKLWGRLMSSADNRWLVHSTFKAGIREVESLFE